MKVGLYFDDDCSDSEVIRGLRALGMRVVRSFDAETYGAMDEVHLARATTEGLVMVTSNEDDFMRLSAAWLRSGREHCGIIVIKQQRFTVRDQVRRFRRLYEEVTADEMKNRVEFLSHWADRE